jgi:hypothetical protein
MKVMAIDLMMRSEHVCCADVAITRIPAGTNWRVSVKRIRPGQEGTS